MVHLSVHDLLSDVAFDYFCWVDNAVFDIKCPSLYLIFCFNLLSYKSIAINSPCFPSKLPYAMFSHLHLQKYPLHAIQANIKGKADD
jgi:hypothetical protein